MSFHVLEQNIEIIIYSMFKVQDIDFQLLNEINKNNNVVIEKNIKFDEKSGYFYLYLKCSNNNEQEEKKVIY